MSVTTLPLMLLGRLAVAAILLFIRLIFHCFFATMPALLRR